jgi:drug/metabolite transporter (DMT)-like permease
MPVDIIAAVLFGAAIHAAWNAIAKGTGHGDPLIMTGAIAVGGAAVALPLLAAYGLPAPASHPHVLASGIIHVVYFLLVGLAYRSADFSAVYPLTRGSAPLITSFLGFALLGEELAPAAWLGIALLGLGVLGLGSDALRRGGLDARSLAVAIANIGVIVTYTLVDGAGTRASANPPGYVLAMMALTGILLLPVLLAWQGAGAAREMLSQWKIGVVGGTMVSLSYGIALWAMTKAPIGMVAALRETSVLFAAVIGALVLRERFGGSRWAGAALILSGLVLMRLA